MKTDQDININIHLEELLSNFVHNFGSLKTLVEEEPTDMVEPQRNQIRDRIERFLTQLYLVISLPDKQLLLISEP